MSRAPWIALGVAAAGVAGAALGVAAERAAVGRRLRVDPEAGEPFGSLRAPARQVLTDDGAQLHVEVDDGEADDLTIVFTHGYCLNLDCWHYQRRDLGDLGRLVFWDQRGHGRSERGPARYGTGIISRLGADLGEVIDAVAPTGPLVLVGHSMGGMTVMALARQRPDIIERVRGVALLGTSAGGLDEVLLGLPRPAARLVHGVAPGVLARASQVELVERVTKERASDLGLLLTRRYSFGSSPSAAVNAFTAEMLTATPLEVVADFLPAFEVHEAYGSLEALHGLEGLVMVGEVDRLTPPEHSAEIIRRLPGFEFVLLPDTGHMLMLERHAEVDAHLRALVGRVRRSLA